MNREQILAMGPEELAEATAVHVMGWERHPDQFDGSTLILGCWWSPSLQRSMGKWNPAEDKSQAWEVLEKYGIVRVERIEIIESHITHTVEIAIEYEEGKDCTVSASDQMLGVAAMRAALIATLDPRGGDAK